MPQDAFTLRHLCGELNALLVGGRINRIITPSNDQVVLTVWTGKTTLKLLLDVNPAMPRISIVSGDDGAQLTASNFCMLLRKHLTSSKIEDIQLVGFDRIVKIDFSTQSEFSSGEIKTLYVELMGRYSNVILTENGKILGGNRGINMFDNGVRPLIVSKPYVMPPSNDKFLPNSKEAINYLKSCDKDNFAEKIISGIQGIALSTAKEIVFRFNQKHGALSNDNFEDFYKFFIEFLYDIPSKPCVIFSNNELVDVCVFNYQTLDGDVVEFNTLYQAEEYYFTQKQKHKNFHNKKERLRSIVNTQIKKVKKRLSAILSKEKEANLLEENKIKGELLLANAYRIKQGEKQCRLINYYYGSEVVIELDTSLSVAKNAENFYKKYAKQKRALLALAPQKQKAEEELKYLSSVSDFIELAESIEELFGLEDELVEEEYIKRQKAQKRQERRSDSKVYVIDGFTVKLGRNNKENDKLIHEANANDLWFHVKDYHSSHAIIFVQNREPGERTIERVSEICAYHSKARDGGKTEVVYTKRKNVKKPSKSKLGFVTYTDFNSITVIPKPNLEFLKVE